MADPIYTAFSPRSLRPLSTYNVNIFVEKTPSSSEEPLRFNAVIKSNTEEFKSEELSILPGSSGTLKIPVGSLSEQRYTLHLKVKDGAGKETEKKDTLLPAAPEEIILIQADKPVYKPGENVQFRVVILDRELRPLLDAGRSVSVKITDPEGNLIRVWPSVTPEMGLFKGDLQLSTEPVLGNWKIQVEELPRPGSKRKSTPGGEEAQAEKIIKKSESAESLETVEDEFHVYYEDSGSNTLSSELSFQVDKYVLPKFEVKVKLPPFLTFKDTKIPVQVIAKYTHGKGVKGNVTLECKLHYYRRGETPPKKFLSMEDGVAMTEVDLKDIFPEGPFEFDLELEAKVMEDVTGISRSGQANVHIHQYPYKIEVEEDMANLKPGLPYRITLKFLTQDNKPINDPSPTAVRITHGFAYKKEDNHMDMPIPPDGKISLTFETPTNPLISVDRIEVKYKELVQNFYVRRASDETAYIELKVGSRDVIEGSPFGVHVSSTEPIKFLVYALTNHRDVLAVKRLQFPSAEAEQDLEITYPDQWDPQARLIVYTVSEGGSIVAESLKLKVGRKASGNFMNITSETTEGSPGDSITLKLSSEQDSLVALRGVDQSVLLLGEDTDINQGRLNQELENSNDRSRRGYYPWWNRLEAVRIFQDGGLVLITNVGGQNEPDNNACYNKCYAAPMALGMAGGVARVAAFDAPVPEAMLVEDALPYEGPEVHVRSNFPETWIWEEIKLNDTTCAELTKVLPDTLTSWIITGFSLHATKGIGILAEPTKVTTIRPFFITLNLPYSVVKGEVLSLQFLLHNYLSDEVPAEITLNNESGQFEFAEEAFQNARIGRKVITVRPNTVTSVEFPITPLQFGSVMLEAKALTTIAGDAVMQALRVKPPGERHHESQSLLLVPDSESASGEIRVNFPEERVPGADRVKVNVIADVLGSTAANMDKLLAMPMGCGEQNMLPFVADIVVLDYFKSSNSLKESGRTKALRYLATGYQRELTYRHSDGSFSAFGSQDRAGSTWLTAFVIRSFIMAKAHIFVDDEVIRKALNFLRARQEQSGRFDEAGQVLHSDMQGGSSSNGVALTAYVLTAFIEARNNWKNSTEAGANEKFPESSKVIESALEYLLKSTSTPEFKDPYALVITAHTLQLAEHPGADEYFERVNKLAIVDGGLKHWDMPKKLEDESKKNKGCFPWHRRNMKPVAVEMTSYVLLTYLMRGKVADAFPIVRWLLKQRNPNGGFISTQDTVVGLTALARYAKLTKAPVTDLTVEIDDGKEKRSVEIKDEDAEVLNELILPDNTTSITASITGKGAALVSLDWEYFVERAEENPAFSLDVKASGESGQLKLETAVAYLGEGKSNMAIVEINLLSGYVIDRDTLPNARNLPGFRRADIENGDTKVNIYFDSLSGVSTKFSVSANRVFRVSRQVAAVVSVYDYYDTTRRATAYYDPVSVPEA